MKMEEEETSLMEEENMTSKKGTKEKERKSRKLVEDKKGINKCRQKEIREKI